MTTPTQCFTVSAIDQLFGQRVNCGSYLTMSEALDYIGRIAPACRPFSEYAHLIHVNPIGYGLIDYSTVVWSSLSRTPRQRR